MLQRFYPDRYENSTYEIDFDAYYQKGYRAILFDIDNTLVPHGFPADARAIKLFEHLHGLGFQCMMLSNNKEPRVKGFCDAVNCQYIFKANKPGVLAYKRGMEQMGCDTSNTLFVGDQIFTDIWGAKKAGIFSILVKPIHPKEEIQIVLKRRLEWFVLRSYLKHGGQQHGN